MVVIHHLFKEIVDVELGARVDDGLDLVEQFVKVDTFGVGDIVECHLAVDTLDDTHLEHGFLSYGTHSQVCLSHNVVLFTIALDEFYKILGIRMLHLTLAHSLYILQLIQRDGVVGCHLFNRYILENDVWRPVQFLGYLLPEVQQHRTKRGVKGTCPPVMIHAGLVFFCKFVIFYNHK